MKQLNIPYDHTLDPIAVALVEEESPSLLSDELCFAILERGRVTILLRNISAASIPRCFRIAAAPFKAFARGSDTPAL